MTPDEVQYEFELSALHDEIDARVEDDDPESRDPRLDQWDATERKTFTDAELALAERRYEKWLGRQ